MGPQATAELDETATQEQADAQFDADMLSAFADGDTASQPTTPPAERADTPAKPDATETSTTDTPETPEPIEPR